MMMMGSNETDNTAGRGSRMHRQKLAFVASVIGPDVLQVETEETQGLRNATSRGLVYRMLGLGLPKDSSDSSDSSESSESSMEKAGSNSSFNENQGRRTDLLYKASEHWLGSSPEEQASITSWMNFSESSSSFAFLFDDHRHNPSDVQGQIGVAFQALNERLASESFLAGGSHETLADVVNFWTVATSIPFIGYGSIADELQNNFPHLSRWYDQMQHFVASRTGSPALLKFNLEADVALMKGNVAPSTKSNGAALPCAPLQLSLESSSPKQQQQQQEQQQQHEQAKGGKEETKGKKEKKEKKEKKKNDGASDKGGNTPAKQQEQEQQQQQEQEQPEITKIDIRVGKIIEAKLHPESEHLFVETVEVGEPEPRTILSGLAEHYTSPGDLVGKLVLVMCNLKPRNMAGIKSNGMVMAATAPSSSPSPSSDDSSKGKVEVVEAPAGSIPGDIVSFEGITGKFSPATPAQIQKKKVLEKVLPQLFTDEKKQVVWRPSENSHTFTTPNGPCTAPTIANGTVS